jgi:hypothetical protein
MEEITFLLMGTKRHIQSRKKGCIPQEYPPHCPPWHLPAATERERKKEQIRGWGAFLPNKHVKTIRTAYLR